MKSLLDFDSTKNHPFIKKKWVIFVVGLVKDRPNQVRYQRIVMLSKQYNVITISEYQLPSSLEKIVYEQCIVDSTFKMLVNVVKIGQRLSGDGKDFYIHTQHTIESLFAGYLCKKTSGAKWVYDLWDHPSLTWSKSKGIRRWFKVFLWKFIARQVISEADAWVIAMHPGVLAHLPPPSVSCRIIWMRPGYNYDFHNKPELDHNKFEMSPLVNIVYVGTISSLRGLGLIVNWAEKYNGPAVALHLVGNDSERNDNLIQRLKWISENNSKIHLKLTGEIPHREAMELLSRAHIGICVLDPKVLNYRYAYPIKIIEYMFYGLIVVATKSHGINSLIDDFETGFLTDFNIAEFKKAIDNAISAINDNDMKEKIRVASNHVAIEYDWRKVNNDLSKQLEKL